MANKEMCQRVLDFLLMHPENHNQSSWATAGFTEPTLDNMCGSTLCTAGAACFLAGEVGYHKDVYDDGSLIWTAYLRNGGSWQSRARTLLGLTEAQAIKLFLGCNEEQAIEGLKKLANGEEF